MTFLYSVDDSSRASRLAAAMAFAAPRQMLANGVRRTPADWRHPASSARELREQ
jgi:hypothetical protein